MSSLTFTDDSIGALKSVGEIARQIGRTRTAVYKAMERIGINPVLKHPFCLYSPDVVEKLRQNMRRQNRKSLQSPTARA